MKPYLLIIILPALVFVSCGSDASEADVAVPQPPEALTQLLDDDDTENPYDRVYGPMPDDGCVKMHINPVGRSLAKTFCDSNHVHMQSAVALGIDPINNDYDAWHLKRPLVKITSNDVYKVDDLTHSYPYLVPEAAALLDEIARMFGDEQIRRGGGEYRLKVTSLLRTPRTVASLRHRNRNATERSTHQYGTTFDISYSKFIYDGRGTRRTQEDLKNLLAEVLYELRDQGRCYVKYERKQGCFHITVRDTESTGNPDNV